MVESHIVNFTENSKDFYYRKVNNHDNSAIDYQKELFKTHCLLWHNRQF